MCGPYVHTKESLIMSTLTTGTYEKYGASYKTLTLTDGEYAFTVTPEKGGMATSFTKNGDEYLWLRDKNFESTDRPRCGIPILFPNCGKPDDGVHHFNGAAYPIEVHGLADLVPWQVKSADDTAIELTLTPNGLTKFVYPFDFALTMRYTLTGSTATLALTVANTGDKALPFSVGFHPYFAASKLDNVAFDIDAATCSESAKGEQPAAPETITLTRKEGSADSIRLMTGVKSPMRFTDSGNGHKVTVSFDESVFTNGVLWQQDAESFVCMEPWNGWANSVNEAGHHIELNPGESKEFKRASGTLPPLQGKQRSRDRIYAAREIPANVRLPYPAGPGMPGPYRAAKTKKDIRPFTSGCPFYCLKASLFTFFSKKVNQPGCLPM